MSLTGPSPNHESESRKSSCDAWLVTDFSFRLARRNLERLRSELSRSGDRPGEPRATWGLIAEPLNRDLAGIASSRQCTGVLLYSMGDGREYPVPMGTNYAGHDANIRLI